jgi:transposase
MREYGTNSKSIQQKPAQKSTNPGSNGSVVYTANFTLTGSKITIEIPTQEDIIKREFIDSSADREEILRLLRVTNVKGVRLEGKKNEVQLMSEWLIRHGVRPLLCDSKQAKHRNDKLEGLPVLNENVAGIDIGKRLLIVAVPPHLATDHTRAFGTFTEDLEDIVKWLVELKIAEVAMESTSVYWVPLFDLCERHGIKPHIVNPKHVKMLPGRKTDVLDARWLMRLLACGMAPGGFIPKLEIRYLRDMARHRQDLMDRAGDCLNRMHKMLALMNIQLPTVISDISGKSGEKIIKAIISGERDLMTLARLADERCKSESEEIAKALRGTYNEAYLLILEQEQKMHECFHQVIIEVERKIQELMSKLPEIPDLPPLKRSEKRIRKKSDYNRSPYCFDMRSLIYQKFGYDLTVIKGIDSATAAVITFETGGNLDAFPTSKHFASWTGVCPGNKVSGGKVLSGKAPKKFNRVGQALRVAANANYHTDNALGARLRRFVRHGKTKKTARKAIANDLSRKVYRIIKHGHKHVEKSAAEYEKFHEERKALNCIRTLRSMGYNCDNINKIPA